MVITGTLREHTKIIMGFEQLINNNDRIEIISKTKDKSEEEWNSYLRQLKYNIKNKNIKNFLQWRVIKNTMFVQHSRYTKHEFSTLKKSSHWNRFEKGMKESSFGSPQRYLFDTKISTNKIHYAYHIWSLEKEISKKVSELDFIIEFGAGYGGMYELIRKLGFSGEYVLFDLKGFSNLQEFYTKNIDIEFDSKKTRFISNKKELESLIRKNESKDSLFIGTWSISETPIKFRNEILSIVENKFKYFFIAYQKQFREIENSSLFQKWSKSLKNYKWKNYELNHLKDNFYLIGILKK